jgi:hypothetical protein
LFFSQSPARSDSTGLDGAVLSGDAFVFVSPDADVVKAEFWLDDDDMQAAPYQTENSAPWDFRGGQSLANPWDTTGIAEGPHSITVVLHLADGAVHRINRHFTVANQAPQLVFSPAALSFAAYKDTDQVLAAEVELASNTALTAAAALAAENPWLRVSTDRDDVPAVVSVSVDTADLAPGVYRGAAIAKAPGLSDAELKVTLHVREPYVQHQVHLGWVHDPASTLAVRWWTESGAGPSMVQFRKVDGLAWNSSTGTSRRVDGVPGVLHEVELTDLAPATSYEYRVQVDDNQFSEAFSVSTAQAAGPASFDAVFVADMALIGRLDGFDSGAEGVLEEIARIDPQLILLGGDYISFISDRRFDTLGLAINEFFRQMGVIATSAAMMPTYGNHEVYLGEDLSTWADRFATPQGLDGSHSYSFDVADVHFASILAAGDEGLSDQELRWLDDDLRSARQSGQRWLIPYFHVPVFSDGANHGSNQKLRDQLGPIFERHGVQLVLTAHDQSFERTFPLRDVPGSNTPGSTSASCYEPGDGVVYMKVSPGGKLSDITKGFSPFRTEPPPRWTAARDAAGHHLAHLAFAESGLTVQTYRISSSARTAPIIDRFPILQASCEPE